MYDWIRRQIERCRALPPWLQDLLVAIVVSQADLVVVLSSESEPGVLGTAPRPVAALAVLLIALPLVFRRYNPNLTMALTGFGAGLAGAFGIPLGPLAPYVALYTVAAYLTLKDTLVATAVFLAIITGLYAGAGALAWLYANVLTVVGVVIIGRMVQAYRLQTIELRHRARELEHSREERARFAVRSERNRIAREMHDVLAHSISVMVVQAAGARRLLPGKPEAAGAALAVIEHTGRQSLTEMRRMLGLLREDDDGTPAGPQPGLDDIPDLVGDFRASGLPVELRIIGDPVGAGDPTVGLSAYRIVQEALTNCLKHATPSRVTVTLRRTAHTLHLEVLDDGLVPGDGPPGGGYGLIGMRERAALVGGMVQAGPRPSTGYRVAATLPLGSAPGPPVPPSPTMKTLPPVDRTAGAAT